MSLIRAGLGMAAGTSPYALTNIAKGGIEGFDTYEQSIKQIKAEEKEYGKLARDLRKEANAVKRSDVDKALDLESKAELMEIERDKLKYTRQSALKPSTFQEQLNALTGGSKDPKVIKEATRTILGVSKTGELTLEDALKTVRDMPKNINATPTQLIEQAKDLVAAQRSGSAVPGVKFLGVR
jgi:cell division protein FtsB